MEGEIARDDRIPAPGPKIDLLRVPSSQDWHLLIHGKQIHGFPVHWDAGSRQSRPHFTQNCPWCIAQMPRKWVGYVHATVHERREVGFVELTVVAATQLQEQTNHLLSLRGCTVILKRSKANNGRLSAVLLREPTGNESLLPERDPLHTLRVLWKLPSIMQLESEADCG